MYPQLRIDKNKIAQNVRTVEKLCAGYGIEVTGITKVFGGEPELARIYVEQGIRRIGDSRVANLKKMKDITCEKWLIRMPEISEAKEVVLYADVSLNSEVATMRALEEAAADCHRSHKVVLMVDLGDLREGYVQEADLRYAIDYVNHAAHLELYGLGTNLTCFNFVQPDHEKLQYLSGLAKKYGVKPWISGGNSATLNLMMRGEIPREVNLLRLGESLLFGRERAGYKYLDGTSRDAFILFAEIIELKEKPTKPWGTIGVDSYGRKPEEQPEGSGLRAICALGRQDVDVETMWPVDEKIKILGASSDHLMVDITQSEEHYRVGNTIAFRLGYFALMRAFTSTYVEKKYTAKEIE